MPRRRLTKDFYYQTLYYTHDYFVLEPKYVKKQYYKDFYKNRNYGLLNHEVSHKKLYVKPEYRKSVFTKIVKFLNANGLGYKCPKMKHMRGGAKRDYDCEYIIDLCRSLIKIKKDRLLQMQFFLFVYRLHPMISYMNWINTSKGKNIDELEGESSSDSDTDDEQEEENPIQHDQHQDENPYQHEDENPDQHEDEKDN